MRSTRRATPTEIFIVWLLKKAWLCRRQTSAGPTTERHAEGKARGPLTIPTSCGLKAPRGSLDARPGDRGIEIAPLRRAPSGPFAELRRPSTTALPARDERGYGLRERLSGSRRDRPPFAALRGVGASTVAASAWSAVRRWRLSLRAARRLRAATASLSVGRRR